MNGVAFWRTQNENCVEGILCFDTINGVLQNIAVPKNDDCYFPSLQQFGQSVAYFVNGPKIEVISMWILRGDPMKDFFWDKKFTVRLDGDIRPEVLGIRNNGELILSKVYDCDLVSYNWEHGEVKDFVVSWNRIGMDREDMNDGKFKYLPFVRPFVEGLVLLDAD